MMKITAIGLDLAKNVMQVHGVDVQGNAVLRKQLRRNQVAAFFATCRRARHALPSATLDAAGADDSCFAS